MNGFTTTHWSLIVAAEETGNPSAPEALANLCSTYWGPVYGYLRRRGFDADRAQDLTQGFFSQILERRFFKEARRERGRFRTFLLSGLKYFLSHERERATAQKRGGGMPELPLDFAGAESAYGSEPADEQTPESIFEKRWARSVLDATLSRLRRSLEQSPEPHRSRRLMSLLTPGPSGSSYREIAAELDMSEGAVKVAVHRMRQRYGEMLREEVTRTVVDPTSVDEELRHLLLLADA